MQEPETWRELLGKRIENSQERQRLADALEVNPITLTRWVSGESNPRPRHLQHLLDALPEQHELLLRLIREEFQGFLTLTEDSSLANDSTAIPGEFYHRVIHTLSILPRDLHFWSLCDLILRQALLQLDPHRLGLAVTVVQCMPPVQGKKVRSLREVFVCGTPPWEGTMESGLILLGAESLAGYAVSSVHLVQNQNLRDRKSRDPGYPGRWEESAVAAPIMFAGGVAGCLLVSSTRPEYFVPARCALVESYAELVALAFDRQEFYKPEEIALGVLPSFEVQGPLLSGFRQRVIDIMGRALRNQQSITAYQAEQLAWQQLEEELLQPLFH